MEKTDTIDFMVDSDSVNVSKYSEYELYAMIRRGYDDIEKRNVHDAKEIFAKKIKEFDIKQKQQE